jgi:hypothetical protein
MLEGDLSVLVLYENFAVGAAVQRRLLDVPMVHLVRGDRVADCEGRYDVIVLCPYVREQRRAEVLARWAGADASTPIIAVRDAGGATWVALLAGPRDSGAARSVISALADAL